MKSSKMKQERRWLSRCLFGWSVAQTSELQLLWRCLAYVTVLTKPCS